MKVMAWVRDRRRGHANRCRRRASVAAVESAELSKPPMTSVQYRRPSRAKAIMLPASSTARPVSTSASALNRISRCSSPKGTVLKAVITKAALMATTTAGSSGAWNRRPIGIAAAPDRAKLPTPTSSEMLLSCATWSSRRSRRVITVVPRPNSLTSVTSPKKMDAIPTRP